MQVSRIPFPIMTVLLFDLLVGEIYFLGSSSVKVGDLSLYLATKNARNRTAFFSLYPRARLTVLQHTVLSLAPNMNTTQEAKPILRAFVSLEGTVIDKYLCFNSGEAVEL